LKAAISSFTQYMLLMCAGNDNLHLLTSDKRQRLRVNLADFEGNTSYAEYDNFEVYSEEAQYRLISLGTYNGTAGQDDVVYDYDVLYCVHEMTLTLP